MNRVLRATTASLLAASVLVALAACKKIEDGAAASKPATPDTPSDIQIEGLKGQREQASYVIGMQIGQTLKPLGTEVDVDTVQKAMRTVLDDGKLLVTDEQAMQVMQAFGQRMQEKQAADAKALGEKNLAEGEKFLAENGKKPGVTTTASGLQYKVVTEGKGEKPAADAHVRVHYKGTLLDGSTFDSSYDRGEPAVFGLQDVVPGWQEAIQLMPVGSKYTFWLPSKIGYGENGTGPIGPNATLVFEVELLGVVDPSAPQAPAAPAAAADAG